MQSILVGLKGINLHIYKSSQRKEHDVYPRALQPANLIPKLSKRIETVLLDFVERDANCDLPPVTIVPQNNIFDAVNIPNTLTVTVRIDLFDIAGGLLNPKTQIAVLTLGMFRPDADKLNYGDAVLVNKIAAIPLGQSDDALDAAIDTFIQYSLKPPLLAATP